MLRRIGSGLIIIIITTDTVSLSLSVLKDCKPYSMRMSQTNTVLERI